MDFAALAAGLIHFSENSDAELRRPRGPSSTQQTTAGGQRLARMRRTGSFQAQNLF
jgi:hypothetical protein